MRCVTIAYLRIGQREVTSVFDLFEIASFNEMSGLKRKIFILNIFTKTTAKTKWAEF